MIIHIKKHISSDGTYEYIQASDVFSMFPYGEEDPKVQRHYMFLDLVEREFNYFNEYRSTAFGNPDLALIQGKVVGWCMAMNWQWFNEGDHVRIKSGKRTLYIIDRPSIPDSEKENRKEIAELRKSLGF